MTDFEIDLDGAEETRIALVSALKESGLVDDDIVEALSEPGVPDWFLSHPFQVIPDLDELSESTPSTEVPEKWRDGLPSRIEASDQAQLLLLYQRVLTSGTRDEQLALIDREHILGNWPALAREVHPVVASVWERRFPGLRR
ncbi:hypothetical protein ACFVYG_20215 [Streptomyces sp. NPDC058256]|uniref:hypothetical protein n=1 Tax=Streptomyces sp. NPDC058256 TaxID=3346408 RepID=UPI0036E02250